MANDVVNVDSVLQIQGTITETVGDVPIENCVHSIVHENVLMQRGSPVRMAVSLRVMVIMKINVEPAVAQDYDSDPD